MQRLRKTNTMFDVSEYVTLKNKARSKRQKAEERLHHFSKGRFIKPCKSQSGEHQKTKTVSSSLLFPPILLPAPRWALGNGEKAEQSVSLSKWHEAGLFVGPVFWILLIRKGEKVSPVPPSPVSWVRVSWILTEAPSFPPKHSSSPQIIPPIPPTLTNTHNFLLLALPRPTLLSKMYNIIVKANYQIMLKPLGAGAGGS